MWKKPKLNSDKIWTIWKKIVKIWKKPKWNSDKIWTIWKKIKLKSEKI